MRNDLTTGVRNVAATLLCIFAAMSFNGCGGSERDAHVHFRDGERTVYSVLLGDPGGDGITGETTSLILRRVVDGREEIHLLSETLLKDRDTVTYDSTLVKVTADGLLPLFARQVVVSPLSRYVTQASYGDSTILVENIDRLKNRKLYFKQSPRLYDRMEDILLARALAPSLAAPCTLNFLSSYLQRTYDAVLAPAGGAMGPLDVLVPAGSFSCRKFTLDLLGSTIDLWISVDPPHYLVKYVDETTRRIFLLLKADRVSPPE